MFHVRTVTTGSGATAVQVVRYQYRKRIIVVHVGSAHSDKEVATLKHLAEDWIAKATHQGSLFSPGRKTSCQLLPVEKCKYLGFHYQFLYEILYGVLTRFKFHQLRNPLLMDLVIARIFQPGSKLQSLEDLEEYFGLHYHRRELYRQLPEMLRVKDAAQRRVVALARKEFPCPFCLVFYDVTTLYYESFTPDDLRTMGFSKDNKPNQPQILIGLLVTPGGFPLAYEIFAGKTFEGHTFFPVIAAFRRKYRIKHLTVVGDAAMISLDTVAALGKKKLGYILGARVANLSHSQIVRISTQLAEHGDGATIRLATVHGDLVCDFSAARYAKDKQEMESQLAKAEALLAHPSGISRRAGKFITTQGHTYTLNTNVVEKTRLLLGIKGYYTNLKESEVSNQMISVQYHKLWHVEHAFRIAKSDLQMRPMYHFTRQAIEVHVLICFLALAVCTFMELKTGKSTQYIMKMLKRVTDARIQNVVTGKEIIFRSEISAETVKILSFLELSH